MFAYSLAYWTNTRQLFIFVWCWKQTDKLTAKDTLRATEKSKHDILRIYEGHLESKKRFAIQRYLLIIGKKQNMQDLSHTFIYFSTQSPWTLRHLSYRDTSLLIPSSYQTAAWLFIGSPWSLSVMNICSPIRKHCAPFSDTDRVHNMFTIDRNKSLVNFTGSDVLRLQNPNHVSHLTVGGSWYQRVHCLKLSHS